MTRIKQWSEIYWIRVIRNVKNLRRTIPQAKLNNNLSDFRCFTNAFIKTSLQMLFYLSIRKITCNFGNFL